MERGMQHIARCSFLFSCIVAKSKAERAVQFDV